jgi:tRNA(fMet)-specific endonuclease VapC
MILLDTNIIVETLKNNKQAIKTFQHIGVENISVSAITVMELYFGAMDKRELLKIKKHIKLLRIIHVNPEISEKAMNLIEKYAKSHTLHIADAFIAATAIHYHLELLTYNVKDFKFIEDIKLYSGKQL